MYKRRIVSCRDPSSLNIKFTLATLFSAKTKQNTNQEHLSSAVNFVLSHFPEIFETSEAIVVQRFETNRNAKTFCRLTQSKAKTRFYITLIYYLFRYLCIYFEVNKSRKLTDKHEELPRAFSEQ